MNVYIFLAGLAVIFTAFGFFLHAFCFKPVGESAAGLVNDKESRCARGDADAEPNVQREVSRLNAAVRVLEQELRLKSEELETLRLLTLAPEEKPATRPDERRRVRDTGGNSREAGRKRAVGAAPLQPDARRRSEIVGDESAPVEAAAAAGAQIRERPAELPRHDSEAAAAGREEAGTRTGAPPAPAAAPPKVGPEGSDSGSWKENLNSVLNILDEMEKEVQK